MISVSWKHRHHRRHAVDQLKAEPQIDQHAQQRIQRRADGLPPQLRSHLWTDDLSIEDVKAREVGLLLQQRNHRRVSDALQRVEAPDQAVALLVAVVQDRVCLLRVLRLSGIRAQMLRISLQQEVGERPGTYVIQIQLARAGFPLADPVDE